MKPGMPLDSRLSPIPIAGYNADVVSNKELNQQHFGQHALNFVVRPTHAKGYSRQRLVDMVSRQTTWRALDIAPGGGNTALAFAARSNQVIATDLNDLGSANTCTESCSTERFLF